MRVLLGITGASGAAYGLRTGALLLAHGAELHVVVTETAWSILGAEAGDGPPPPGRDARKRWLTLLMEAPRPFALHGEHDYAIPFASGSNPADAVVVAPCSMGTLARIAHGTASSALTRCADVALKERKPLVLVPRETPLSAIHLENMLALSRAGADIVPACPGFYHRPAAVRDLVDFVVARVLARLGIDARLHPRWGEAAPGTGGAAGARPRAGRRGRREG